MRPVLRSSSTLAPAALVALSLAVCLGSTATGPAVSERRSLAEQEQAVASLMACLEQAAKSLAGQTAAVVEHDAESFILPTTAAQPFQPADDAPVVSVQPHLSLLNLPPPAPLS